MRLNNIGYLLKEGFRGVFQHGFMSFAAVCVTVACLVIVGSFSALAYNLDEMVKELNQTSEILVYIDADLPDAEAKSIGTQINLLDNVLEARFVSRQEALQNFIDDHDGDSAFSGVQAEDLRHRYVVTLEDNSRMKQTDEQLKQLPGVAKTNAAYELAEGFSTIQDVLHIVSAAIIAVLLVVSLLIISNTVKLAMYDRKDEIAIMKMVGALLAFGLEWAGYDAMLQKINEVDSLQLFSFVPFQELLVPMVAVFAAAGMFVGIVGSWTSIRKFMDV